MPNQLEEELRVLKNRKIILREEIKNETDRKKLMSKIQDMNTLVDEERDILRRLGVSL